MKPVAIIIPVYKTNLSAHEEISLEQCIRIMGKHPIVLVKPETLAVHHLISIYPNLQVETFAEDYFRSLQGYNRLLCSDCFYERFADYEYILICQLDAFILRDELLDWCQRGYDYIGAPQFAGICASRTQQRSWREWLSLPFQRPLLNGGLSLRRVAACRRLLRVYHQFFRPWSGNEDGFFSLHFPRLLPFRLLMKFPPVREALLFAIEFEPLRSLALNDQKLPMGGHAWAKYDLAFWRSLLAPHGYVV